MKVRFWVSLFENVIESMKRKKKYLQRGKSPKVLEIPQVDNSYKIKNCFG